MSRDFDFGEELVHELQFLAPGCRQFTTSLSLSELHTAITGIFAV